MNSGFLVKFAVVALVALLSALPAFAVTINVSSSCSLAEAIDNANDDAQTHSDCPAGSGNDIINMPATASTLRLSATLPAISSFITINGRGWTISGDGDNDGDGDTRLFLISSGKLTINNMTLTKAHANNAAGNGGAIRINAGALELNNSVMSDNSVDGHGGAIFVAGSGTTATIFNSRFSNNKTIGSADGGAIYNHGNLTVSRSAFNGNRGQGAGYAGAIYASSSSGSTTISNSTFYGNSASRGGAVYASGGTVKLLHVTITNNTAGSNGGGGVYTSASGVEIKNSLLSGNTGDDCRQTSTVTGVNTNLIRTGNCGTPFSSADPRLPSSVTGSPPYFALPSNSLAVNAVDCLTGVAVDQAGTSRPQPAGGSCDIGAFELVGAAATATSTPTNTPTAMPTSTSTPTPTNTQTPTATATATATPTATATATATATNTPTSTATNTPINTPTPTNTPINTPTPTNTPINTPTPTNTPTSTPVPTGTPVLAPTRDDRDNQRATRIVAHPSWTPTTSSTKTPAPSTCLTLTDHIRISNITHSTQCRQVDSNGIGNAEVLALGFRDGVDVWGWVLPNMQICFEGSGGSFRFLDAATSPRAVSELPAVGMDGMICTTINRAGTVALVDGPPAPAPSATPPVYQSLSGCMVTTAFILNFRDAPAGDVIDAVPYNVTLTALERTDGWFKVDYHGARGWISAVYVEPVGACG